MKTISCIAVDDMAMSREAIKDLIEEVESFQLLKICNDAIQASNFLKKNHVDVMFLDIEMPKMNGLELIRTLKNAPLIILTTSHTKFAVDGFDLNVFDYLVKPISHERFFHCVEKIINHFNAKKISANNSADLLLRDGKEFISIKLKDIVAITSNGDYVVVDTGVKTSVHKYPLKSILEMLPEYFLQIHRSFIINMRMIEKIKSKSVVVKGKEFPIGLSFEDSFQKNYFDRQVVMKKDSNT